MLAYLTETLLSDPGLSEAKKQQLQADIKRLANPRDPYMEDDLYERIRRQVVEYFWRYPTPMLRAGDPGQKR